MAKKRGRKEEEEGREGEGESEREDKERKSLAYRVGRGDGVRLVWFLIASLFLIVSLLIAGAIMRSCEPPPAPIVREVTVERTVIITVTPPPTNTPVPVTPTKTATSVFDTPVPLLTLNPPPTDIN